MDVDAVEKRTRNAIAVALDLAGRASALTLRIAEETARAGVHRGNEDEVGRECHGARSAADRDPAVLERLAQHFERGAFELGEFVQKKHAVVRDADFTGRGIRGAADQTDVADRVMRGAERAA